MPLWRDLAVTVVRVYGWVRSTGGVSWYRVQEPLRGLALLGHEVSHGPDLNFGKLPDYDVIVTSVHGEAHASEGWETLARLPVRPLMVYDIDDDVWNFREGLHQYDYWQDAELLRNVQSCIACADIVTTPSPVLAEIMSALNPNVHVYGNYVPQWLTEMWIGARASRFTIGYQGGDTHRYDIATIGPEVLQFLGDNLDTRMSVWGAATYDGLYPERVDLVPWEKDIRRYYMSLRMSVGLAPLEDMVFNYAKSGLKAVEYAALGIPCLATDIAPYRSVIAHGVTGLLLDPGEWYDALKTLHTDRLFAASMGQSARRLAEQWTTERNNTFYEALLLGGLHG